MTRGPSHVGATTTEIDAHVADAAEAARRRLDEPHARGAPEILEVQRSVRATGIIELDVQPLERSVVELGVTGSGRARLRRGFAQGVEALESMRGDRRRNDLAASTAVLRLAAGRNRQIAVSTGR